jgi:hypothetical protein
LPPWASLRETIRSIEDYGTQKEASAKIAANNVQMQRDGVHPGVLQICRKLALMPDGRRGLHVALLHRYLQVFAARVPKAAVGEVPPGPIPFKKSA